jgi:TPR repeat protein
MAVDPGPRDPAAAAVGGPLFLATLGIVGAASVGSLFAAGFLLLKEPQRLVHPAAAAPSARLASAQRPTETDAELLPAVIAPAAPAPPRTALAPPAAARPSGTAAAPPAKPLPTAAQLAMAQADARFASGDPTGARFFYEQATDAGDATAALRMGETFDPAVLRADRLRFVRGDPAAARFWYDRALALGSTEAKQRLDALETEETDGRATPTLHRRWRYHRYLHRRVVTFREMLEHISHPRSDGP